MTQAEETRLAVPVGERDHMRGRADAPITLVEYGDYECPDCGSAGPIVRGLRRRLGAQLRFVFRNFPRVEIHPHAQHAAEAAEAAEAQGRFWEMHDVLFEHQQALEDADLVRYAAQLGLDRKRFERELAEHVYAPRVHEDVLGGLRSEVDRTPTFFLDGVRQGGFFSLAALPDALEVASATRRIQI